MQDGKRHSPQKQIQAPVKVKTMDLTTNQKETLKQKIKVLKLQRELNRPVDNLQRTEQGQTYKPIRISAKHNLPDEKKLRNALSVEMRKL